MDPALLNGEREMTMHIRTTLFAVAALGSLASMATGCGSSSSSGPTEIGQTRASLHRAKNCGDLLTDLKADAKFKVNKGIDQQITYVNKCIQANGDANCATGGYIGGYATSDSAGGRGLGTAPPQAGGAEEAANGAPSDDKATSYSETNTQVKGVDEADFVKNDGKYLYVLHGRQFKMLNAWPADAIAELSSLDIEGTPSEMFVADGKVVVYSQVNGTPIYAAAGVTPKAAYQDFYGYGGGGSTGAAVDVAAPREGGYPSTGEAYVPLTKVTVLTLQGTTPVVSREVYFEGNYLSARRVGADVRTVLQHYAHGPKLKYGVWELYENSGNSATPVPETGDEKPSTGTGSGSTPYPQTGTAMIAALEQLRAENTAAIDASTLDQWVPNTFVKEGAGITTKPIACEDYYVPTTGSTESGLTEVASLNLADPAALPKQTAILGRADTVYANTGTLYLAAHAWVEIPIPVSFGSGGGDTAVSSPPSPGSAPAEEPREDSAPAPTPGGFFGKIGAKLRPQTTPQQQQSVTTYSTAKTHLHKFEFATDPKFPNYVASGTVVGAVKDQFALDEKDGFLRVATTEQRTYLAADGSYVSPSFETSGTITHPQTVNRVFALGQNGAWLDIVGDVGELAPNERIYSVRFVESRGYVVTFRQVDPLFVIDLAAPQSPSVLAALKIPGFSEYMHPLDANHLLTIGRDATNEGRVRGLQLQIFDVTDGANPILQHKFLYSGQEYGQSEAEYNHKAFTYFADKNLLAFPYYSYGNGGDGGMRSSLELFRVDLGSGFQKVGSVDHSPLVSTNPSGYCNGYYGPQVRRGVFLENFVYSISYGGVVVKDANNLGAAGAQLALPAPQVNPGYGPEACY